MSHNIHEGIRNLSPVSSISLALLFFYFYNILSFDESFIILLRTMRGREKSKTSFGNPWSSVGWNSSSQELKFISLTRATRVYQK